jgi:hypothetical protein
LGSNKEKVLAVKLLWNSNSATLITFRFLEVIFLVVQMTTELGNLIVWTWKQWSKDDFNKQI